MLIKRCNIRYISIATFIVVIATFSFPKIAGAQVTPNATQISFSRHLTLPNDPVVLTTDLQSNIYVTTSHDNTGTGHAYKLSPNGTIIHEIGSSGPGENQFTIGSDGTTGPGGISIDLSGYVYITDLGKNKLFKFDQNGQYVSTFHDSNHPFTSIGYVSVSPDGYVYISGMVSSDSVIQKFDRLGNFISQFDDYSISNDPSGGLSFDYSNNIYIANTSDGTISKISPAGVLLNQIRGPNGNDMLYPTDVAVDISGNIFVSTFLNNSIFKFDQNGNFLEEYNQEWDDDNSQFRYLYSITINNTGEIIVPDGVNRRLALLNDPSFLVPEQADSDNDGIYDTLEDGAPNNGDVNGDGIPDKYQTKVTSYPVDENGAYTSILNSGCSENDSVEGLSTNTLEYTDDDYSYPYGFTSFKLKCQIGASASIKKYMFTDETADQFVLRKYRQDTHSFITVEDAIFSDQIIGGHHAVRAEYFIVDGGTLDDDGLANGVIVDPVGFASVKVSSNNSDPGSQNVSNNSSGEGQQGNTNTQNSSTQGNTAGTSNSGLVTTGTLPRTGISNTEPLDYSMIFVSTGLILTYLPQKKHKDLYRHIRE